MMNVVTRVKAPTPKFFKVLRTIGLSLATASAVVLTAPVALPAAALTIAGYVAVGASVMTAVSQTAVEDRKKTAKPNKKKDGDE